MAELSKKQAEERAITVYALNAKHLVYELVDRNWGEPDPHKRIRVAEPIERPRLDVSAGALDLSEATVTAYAFRAYQMGGYEDADGRYRIIRMVCDCGVHGDVVVWTGMRRRY